MLALKLIPILKLSIILSKFSRPQHNLNYKNGPQPTSYNYSEPLVKEKKTRKKDTIKDKFILVTGGLYIYYLFLIFISVNIFLFSNILLISALLIAFICARSSDFFLFTLFRCIWKVL